MSRFTDFDAFYAIVPGSRLYELAAPLAWDIGCEGSGWVLDLAWGTRFDISVPRWLEWVLSPHDRRVLPAAAIHDELLRKGHDAAFASAEFRRAAIARGVRPWFGWLLFAAVFFWTIAVHPQHSKGSK